jgi:DNA (cytosine-5)-methyltransferase 1
MTERKCEDSCASCDEDRAFLTLRERPDYEEAGAPVSLVDLFAGCGGMSLGIAEAARRSRLGLRGALSVDFDPIATQVYQRNFPATRVETCGVEQVFDGDLGARPTSIEKDWQRKIGPVDVLIGGPPCQGHSDLNNRSRRHDPRNELYLRMARAAEVLCPKAILIENVPAVRHARQGVVGRVEDLLKQRGYAVRGRVLDVSNLGVAQRRKRHVLLALHSEVALDPEAVLQQAGSGCATRDLRWAIGDLADIEPTRDFDRPSRASAENRKRMAWFFEEPGRGFELPDAMRPPCHRDKAHTYKSVYGRLDWEKPAQTITTGFTSMGQGRYVHPHSPRTLTPHEAARIQGFPDFFDFQVDGSAKRTGWSKLIGNAVPPQLSMLVMLPVLQRLAEKSRTVPLLPSVRRQPQHAP